MALRRGGTQKRWHTEEVARRRGRHRRTQKRKAQRHAEEVALRRGGTQKRWHTEEEGTEAHRRGRHRGTQKRCHTEEEGTDAHGRGRHRGTQKRKAQRHTEEVDKDHQRLLKPRNASAATEGPGYTEVEEFVNCIISHPPSLPLIPLGCDHSLPNSRGTHFIFPPCLPSSAWFSQSGQ